MKLEEMEKRLLRGCWEDQNGPFSKYLRHAYYKTAMVSTSQGFHPRWSTHHSAQPPSFYTYGIEISNNEATQPPHLWESESDCSTKRFPLQSDFFFRTVLLDIAIIHFPILYQQQFKGKGFFFANCSCTRSSGHYSLGCHQYSNTDYVIVTGSVCQLGNQIKTET